MQPLIPAFNHIKDFSAAGWRDEPHSAWTCSGLSGSIGKIWLHRKDLLTKSVSWIGADRTWDEKFVELQPAPISPSLSFHRSERETASARSHGCKNGPTSAPSETVIASARAQGAVLRSAFAGGQRYTHLHQSRQACGNGSVDCQSFRVQYSFHAIMSPFSVVASDQWCV